MCLNRDTDYYKRSYSWYALDFYQANQLEIKLNKNATQAFCFGLKFSQTSSHCGIKLEISAHNSRNTLLL